MEPLKDYRKVKDCHHLFMRHYPSTTEIHMFGADPKGKMLCVNCGAYKRDYESNNSR